MAALFLTHCPGNVAALFLTHCPGNVAVLFLTRGRGNVVALLLIHCRGNVPVAFPDDVASVGDDWGNVAALNWRHCHVNVAVLAMWLNCYKVTVIMIKALLWQCCRTVLDAFPDNVAAVGNDYY